MKITSRASVVAILLVAYVAARGLVSMPASADALPALNQTVVEGSIQDLEEALIHDSWSKEDLGGALIAAAGTNQATKAKLLIKRGADVDFAVLQRTPLIIAAHEDSVDAASVLLESGANPNYVSSFDWRPLHNAMRSGTSNDDIISLLLSYGADVDARTNLQVTPLHRAAGFCLKSAVELLLKHGANKSLLDKYGQTAAERAQKAGCADVAELLR